MSETKQTSVKRAQQQKQAVLRIVILAVILVLVNVLAARFHTGIDLTREKRFTLSPATKRMLKATQQPVVIEVYLNGELPAGFQRLREATREKLQSFKNYAGAHLKFHFKDPFENK